MNGKGSRRRKCQISQEEYQKNWDFIFNPIDTTTLEYSEEDAVWYLWLEKNKINISDLKEKE